MKPPMPCATPGAPDSSPQEPIQRPRPSAATNAAGQPQAWISLLLLLLALLPQPAACQGAEQAPLNLLPGFEARIVYSVPREQGSWVALTAAPTGDLISSDQFGTLYRLRIPTNNAPAAATPLELQVGWAQGLLCVSNHLYVTVNRGPDQGGSALLQLTDTNDDHIYDRKRVIQEFDGHGEHGPHAIVADPSSSDLYLIAGNATRLPPLESSLVPRNWAPDELLPHLMQTDGVWRNDRPGGWICRLTPETASFQLVAIGLRNPYDLACNADGEWFTFDADMEWDLGTHWYRPTRVNHVTSGAEFGWRTGSGKWPDYTPDSLGSVVDIGESSPTGLTFGYDANFPERYQKALFLGDWSYGKIYALHLEPMGASYSATYETFLSGTPLPVTDLVILPSDRNLYFTVGGRQTPSQVYQVRYTGPLSTSTTNTRQPDPDSQRQLRHQLESLHQAKDPSAITLAWPSLSHTDRAIRFAARTAIEHQPPATWMTKALEETQPRTAMAALLAVARNAPTNSTSRLLHALNRFPLTSLPAPLQLEKLRIITVALCRLAPPNADEKKILIQELDPHFPSASFQLNRDLSTILSFLHAPSAIAKSLGAMNTSLTQEEALHYALNLRTLPGEMWTIHQLEHYLNWHNQTMARGGGVTFAEYLLSIRSEILDKQNQETLSQLHSIIHAPPPRSPLDQLRQRDFVREWSTTDLLPDLQSSLTQRNFNQGQAVFAQAMCLKCHRFRGQGGLTGPELTGIAARFDLQTILESILEPSKVISDQYATIQVITTDGEDYTGRIGDHTDDAVVLKYDLFNPANLLRIPNKDIESIQPSSSSLMPPNLLDYFTRDEILDLIAYLLSQGDPTHKLFQ